LRHNLSIGEIEIIRKNINPSCSIPNIAKVVPYLYLLINCVKVSFIHIHHVHEGGFSFHIHQVLFLVYVRHFLNHVVIFFGSFLAPPLAQRPRQPPSSPNGNAGSGCSCAFKYNWKKIRAPG